jgi:hypothetical protein
VRELRLDLVVEHREAIRLQPTNVLVQRVDEHGERQVVLELRRRPEEDEVPAGLGASGKLPQEPRLADPRFARHLNHARTASIELVQDPLERTELVGPPHQVPGIQSHTLLFRALRWYRGFEATQSGRHALPLSRDSAP